MPKLVIVDHLMSAGGLERFLQGLVGGLLTLPEVKRWDITLLLNRRNSGGYPVRWPKHLTAGNVTVNYLHDDISGVLKRLRNPRRIFGIPGTGRVQRVVPWFLRQHGPSSLREHAVVTDDRLWIERFWQRHRFDVTYFSYPYLMECPQIPAPMVATPHDFNYKRFDTLGRETCAQMEREMPEWLRRCRQLVVSSNFAASELSHFYPEFAGKVRVIRLGIPRSSRIPTTAEVERYRRQIGLPKDFLLVAGWIAPHKDQKVVFRALGDLRRKGLKIPLVCVGPNSHQLAAGRSRKGSYVQEVVQVAKDVGLQELRDFRGLGYVDALALECLYRSATALIVPSLYEAGSFPAREAMLAGLPVILSQIPPLAEEEQLVEGNAWMFRPSDHEHLADVIQELLSNHAERSRRARGAAQIVPQVYSWKRTAEGYFSIFQQLAA